MTKKDFETAIDRSIEAMLDGGQPGIDDILLISKALGGASLELMSKDERDTYLFGVEAGYKLGNGEKSGCKCEQTVLLNGTAYCANCGRKL